VVVLLAGLLSFQPAQAATGVNESINFQGRLLTDEGATVPDGFYNIQFRIYQDGDGQTVGTTGSPAGSPEWTENHINANGDGVTVKNGFLSVQLGSVNDFGSAVDWNQDTLWLSMNIGNTGASCTPFSNCSPDGEMLPMKRLSATPYSLNSALLGGVSSAGFVQLAQGLQTDATANTSINLNKTGAGDIVSLQSAGSQVFAIANDGDISLGANTDRTLQVAEAATDTAGRSLTIAAGSADTTSGSAVDGGDLLLEAGAGSATGSSGSVIVRSNTTDSDAAFSVQNAASDSLFNIDAANRINRSGSGLTQPVPRFEQAATINSTGGSIATGTTYYYAVSAQIASIETEVGQSQTVAIATGTATNSVDISWTQSTGATGYKLYRNTVDDFSSGSLLLATISGGANTSYTDTGAAAGAGLPPARYTPVLQQVDSAAASPFGNGQTDLLGAMYYNTTLGEFQCYKDVNVGGSWSDCGVTDLQGAYNNIDTDTVAPTIKVDSSRDGFSIQDADTSINDSLFSVRASNASGLGTALLDVNSRGTVTIQNETDQDDAFRVLGSSGQYLLNANAANGYFITNTTRSTSNQLLNAGFEAGGTVTSGQQGWNGPAQASIISDSGNAHGGNYVLEVSPNATSLKTYAGTYYEVQPGDTISFEGWVKNSAGANGSGGVLIEGYTKDKVFVGSSSDAGNLPGTSYVFRSTSYTAPSNVTHIRVAALVNPGASSGSYYFDDFYLASSIRGQQIVQNTADSTDAFRIRSADAAQTLFTANTTDNVLRVGDSTGSDTDTTLLIVDSSGTDPSTSLANKNGGLFYRSDTNSLKAVVGNTIVDICTTAVTCSGYSASAGSTIQLQTSSPGTQQSGNFNITGTGILTQLQTQDRTTSSTNSDDLTIRTGNATGATSDSGNLVLDVGTATGSPGSITIGHSGVATTIGGTLDIQGSNTLSLGTSSSETGSILFRTSAGGNSITLQAPGANPSSSYSLTLPQNLGSSGDCLKDTGSGALGFSDCGAGVTVTLQDVYDNSNPAEITLANSKDFVITAQQTSTDPNVLINLACASTCGANGRFAVQNAGTDVLTVNPAGGGIVLNATTRIGGTSTNSTQTNFILDSSNQTSDVGSCTETINQGAMYYNTTTGSIRACVGGVWSDLSNPDTLGLLSYGIVPSSGSNPYDIPSLEVAGASGPCKVSWASSTSVSIEACVAYSDGRRVNVDATTLSTNTASGDNTSLTIANSWGHVCLVGTQGQPAFTSTTGFSTAIAGLPTFSISEPILCLADIRASSNSGQIGDIYDTRTFTSTLKEAVNSSTAVELGMLVDASGTNGALEPSNAGADRLYGLVVASDGATSSDTPNVIISTVGPGWAKSINGTSGNFVITSNTDGYAQTTTSIPNNSFYYSAGYARSAYSTTCSAASNCSASLYVNFIVR